MTTVLLRLVLPTEMSKTISTDQPQTQQQSTESINPHTCCNQTFRCQQPT